MKKNKKKRIFWILFNKKGNWLVASCRRKDVEHWGYRSGGDYVVKFIEA